MMHLSKIIFNNFWMKALSLVLAIVTWLYISEVILGEKTEEESPLHRIISTYRYISKELGVEPVFVGYPPSGYELVKDEVTVQPKRVIVVGPRPLLEKARTIKTDMIDLSEYTRTSTTDVKLMPISKHIDMEKVSVKVTIPIKKIAQ